MTLLDAILKAKTHEEGKYSSPPPEVDSVEEVKIKRVHKYAHVPARVDSSAPQYNPETKVRKLEEWRLHLDSLFKENLQLLMRIKRANYMGGRVDCHWHKKPVPIMQYYQHRVDFLKTTRRENLALYKRILSTNARVDTSAELNRAWTQNKRKIVEQASAIFVLFPPVPHEEMEDLAFKAAPDVKRPRVYLQLGIHDGAVIGEICVELFTDTCPNTCRLFLELVDGDSHGYGYVKTCFFSFPKDTNTKKEWIDATGRPPNWFPTNYSTICSIYFKKTRASKENRLFEWAIPKLRVPTSSTEQIPPLYRKVPHLYWSGGDVIYNNGFGCYAQVGRDVPIGAENYHYPHSMPGLLSMRVTVDDEMCGIFNITFKPLPQLDLRNVVFGRVIRPSSTYDIISRLGNALSSRPVVEIWSTRRKVEGRWVRGAHNTELAKRSSACLRKKLKNI